MSTLYVIRHGQAGTRQRYDTLSDIGVQQARLLGQYLAGRGVIFHHAIRGGLHRQIETGKAVADSYREIGLPFPDAACDPGWNEFDLDGVFREMAPRLSAADPTFRDEYERLRIEARDASSPLHRQWTHCDAQVIRAWIRGEPCGNIETWATFLERVRSRTATLLDYGPDENVAIFTSATALSVWIAAVLGVEDRRIMRLAAVLYNTAFSTVRMERGEPMLVSFNVTAHLPDSLLTLR